MVRPTLVDEGLLALEVVLDLARLGSAKGSELALRQGLHRRYLERILWRLAHEGILVGERGRRGGYQLARNAALITASDVLRAVRRDPIPRRRAHGSPEIRELLKQAEERTLASLQGVTIASLASQYRSLTTLTYAQTSPA
jgi:Rrf2 family transcriptional regulator, iron-sulfur cluster assembly transcription factor